MKEAWEKQGAVPMVMTPDEFGAHVQSEIEKWAKIIKANAISSRNEWPQAAFAAQ